MIKKGFSHFYFPFFGILLGITSTFAASHPNHQTTTSQQSATPDWKPEQDWNSGDIVKYKGNNYIALVSNRGMSPETSDAWTLDPAEQEPTTNSDNKILLRKNYLPPAAQPILFQDISYVQARKVAKEQEKYIFIDFYADWCGPCKMMEKFVFTEPKVAEYMNKNYIALRVDVESQEADLIRQLKIEALPTMMFYAPSGKTLHRQEGTLDLENFLKLATQMVNLDDYTKDYQKNNEKTDHVVDYTEALQWSNPTRAKSIAIKYLAGLPEKKYTEPENWKLIQDFVEANDRPMFPRLLKSEDLFKGYPAEYKTFINARMDELLKKAVEEKYAGLLKTYVSNIDSYPQYFQSPDSLQLAGKLAYAKYNQEDNLLPLLEEFIEKYESKNPERLAQLALEISQETFKRPVLEYVLRLGDQSLAIKKGGLAYLAKALAHDRLGEYKPAYANLLLAYQYADEEMTETLSQFESQIKKKLTYEFANGVNTIKENGDDGRFTLGAGTKRLMYGYPIPKSTSHFIVNIDGKLASNGGHLKERGVQHLSGTMSYGGEGATPRVSISFEFEKVRITQVLAPVDKEGKDITTGLAQFYRISYKFENLEFTPKTVGLGMLFDTMIDDNDYCAIAADGKIVNEERSFQFNAVPKELLFYRTKRDTADMMGSAQLSGLEPPRPIR